MKKGLLIGFVVLMLAGSLSAGDVPYIGIFASPLDVEDTHSTCSISPVPYEDLFVMWIWVLPSSRGMNAVEFRLSVPASMTLEMDYPLDAEFPVGEVANPNITIQLGSLSAGISSAFGSCQQGWTWTHKRWYSSRSTTPRFFSIVAHPGSGLYQVASCELGNPLEPATRLTHLYLYQPCVYATKDASWGAIKSLF